MPPPSPKHLPPFASQLLGVDPSHSPHFPFDAATTPGLQTHALSVHLPSKDEREGSLLHRGSLVHDAPPGAVDELLSLKPEFGRVRTLHDALSTVLARMAGSASSIAARSSSVLRAAATTSTASPWASSSMASAAA